MNRTEVPNGCELVSFSTVTDPRGSLSAVEGLVHIPFEIERVFYLYDVPFDQRRAAHTLYTCSQLLIAVSGSFIVELDDTQKKSSVTLDRPDIGLLIAPMIWREISAFNPGSVCLVLASERYDPDGYIRDYSEYREKVRSVT